MLDSQLHQGLAGCRRWIADWAASSPEWETETIETVELHDRRILTTHRIGARGRSTGLTLKERHAQLWFFRWVNRHVTEGRQALRRADAAAQAEVEAAVRKAA
jgi:hypothetical protein